MHKFSLILGFILLVQVAASEIVENESNGGAINKRLDPLANIFGLAGLPNILNLGGYQNPYLLSWLRQNWNGRWNNQFDWSNFNFPGIFRNGVGFPPNYWLDNLFNPVYPFGF